MNREIDILKGFISAAFTHHRKIMDVAESTHVPPPTPAEAYHAYKNDPTIKKLTDAVVYGVSKISTLRLMDEQSKNDQASQKET